MIPRAVRLRGARTRRRRGRCVTACGGGEGVGAGFFCVEVGGELGVVVEAFDVEGGEDGFLDRGAEGIAFLVGAAVEEGEGGVGEVDGEGVVGGGDGEVGRAGGVGGDEPVEGGEGVGLVGGVGHAGFALPGEGIRGAFCGGGREVGGECVGAGGEGTDWRGRGG